MFSDKDITKLLKDCYAKVHREAPIVLLIEQVGLRTPLFSGLRSEVEKLSLAYLLNLSSAAPDTLLKERMPPTEKFKRGTINVCEKRTNANSVYSLAKKEAKVMEFLSRKTDVVPWVFGFDLSDQVGVLMEYLGDLNLGRFLTEPNEAAQKILYKISVEHSVTKDKLYNDAEVGLSKSDIDKGIEELIALRLVSEQDEGNEKKLYVTDNFGARFDENESRKNKKLCKKESDERKKWNLLKEGISTSFELRSIGTDHLKDLKQIAHLRPFYIGYENQPKMAKKVPSSVRVAHYIVDYELRKILGSLDEGKKLLLSMDAQKAPVLEKLAEDIKLLDTLKNSFLTNDNYVNNFMIREKVTDQTKLPYPLNNESRGGKLVIIDGYHACYGPWILDDADYILYNQVALGLEESVITSLSDMVLGEARQGKFKSALSNEEGHLLLKKVSALKAIRYLKTNLQQLKSTTKPLGSYEREFIIKLNDSYKKLLQSSFDSHLFSADVSSFFKNYLLDKI